MKMQVMICMIIIKSLCLRSSDVSVLLGLIAEVMGDFKREI
jgi:hypothetical protein